MRSLILQYQEYFSLFYLLLNPPFTVQNGIKPCNLKN